MRKYIEVLLSLTTILFTAGCGNGNKPGEDEMPTPESLNDKGMHIITHAKDSQEVYKGLFYLDQAINMDSTYIIPYINKMNTLLRMNMSAKALETLQKLNAQQPIPENVMFEGWIYERVSKDSLKAQTQYRAALELYDKSFEATGDSTLLLNKGFVVLFLQGKEAGISYYKQLESAFAANELYEKMKKQAEHFDKEAFLRSLW